jgi:hypothetical protein
MLMFKCVTSFFKIGQIRGIFLEHIFRAFDIRLNRVSEPYKFFFGSKKRMLSQQHLIYLAIVVLIIIIAFFAYQELQKHHMEIEKLRHQSQKLEKIIHAYNMRQWHQSVEQREYESSEDDNTSNEDDDEEFDDEEKHEIVNNFLGRFAQPGGPQNTLFSVRAPPLFSGAPAPPTAMPETRREEEENTNNMVEDIINDVLNQSDEVDLPEVEDFEAAVGGAVDVATTAIKSLLDEEEEPADPEDEVLTEMEQDEAVDDDVTAATVALAAATATENAAVEEKEDILVDETVTDGCPELIKSGTRKGEPCGAEAKMNGMCLRHFRYTTKA